MGFARLLLRAFVALAVAVVATLAPGAGAAERNLLVAANKAQPAAEPRIALVIGNADYPRAPLANPVNDARAIAARLAELRFRVTRLENATQEQMYAALRDFGDQLRGGGVGLFYYAGHALQVRGRNYLLPARAMIEREDEIIYRTVDTGQILDKMESARNRVNVVILDACRNNPFGREFRNVTPGLAVVDAPYNTLIAFATAPGAVASDGSGSNGLYTEHLLASLARPGLRLEDVFKQVRKGVRQDSAGRQVPWENTSLEVDFFFDPTPGQTLAVAPAPPDALTLELAFWDSVKGSTDPADYRAYLQRYPDGQFAALATNRLRVLADKPPAATVLAVGAAPVQAPALAAAAPPAPALPAPVAASAGVPLVAPLRALTGPAAGVLTLALSRSGGQALSAGADRTLRLWDLASGREWRQFGGPAAAVTSAALAPDPRWLLAGSADASLRLFDAVSGAELARLEGHRAAVSALAFDPTSRYAASVAVDGEILLWALPEGRLVRRGKADAGPLRSVQFSPEGRVLLTVDDAAVRLWDIGTLQGLRRFGPLAAPAVSAAFGDNGRHVVAVDAAGEVWTWQTPSGELLQRQASGARPPVRAAVAADGASALLAGADGQLLLWSIGSGQALWRSAATGRPVSALALGARGAPALSASDDRGLLLWPAGR